RRAQSTAHHRRRAWSHRRRSIQTRWRAPVLRRVCRRARRAGYLARESVGPRGTPRARATGGGAFARALAPARRRPAYAPAALRLRRAFARVARGVRGARPRVGRRGDPRHVAVANAAAFVVR